MFCTIIDIQNLSKNREEYEILLCLLNKISKNHYRHPGFQINQKKMFH